MGVGTNLQRSMKSPSLLRPTGSTSYGRPSTTGFSAQKGSQQSSRARQQVARQRERSVEAGNPEHDADYGIHKVAPPLFFEVTLNADISTVAHRLRKFGRAFVKDAEVVQVAHVLRKRGRFFICHFKSLLYLDDVIRREDITMRDLAETLAAVDMLVKADLVVPQFGPDWRKDTFGPAPAHVRDVSADRDIHWRPVSKYTFKKPE